MVEVFRTNDAVMLSWLEAVLREQGIPPVVLDTHMSIVEGSIGAIPRRLMVAASDGERARAILREVGVDYDPRNN